MWSRLQWNIRQLWMFHLGEEWRQRSADLNVSDPAPSLATPPVASYPCAALVAYSPSALDPGDRGPFDRSDGDAIERDGDASGVDGWYVRDGLDAGRHAVLSQRKARLARLLEILPSGSSVHGEVLSRSTYRLGHNTGPHCHRGCEDAMGRQSTGSAARPTPA